MAGETKKVCSVDGCGREKAARGMCRRCYLRWLAAGGTGKTCSFEGCDKPLVGKGLCNGHYRQQRKGQELRPLYENGQPWSYGATLEDKIKAAEEVAERTEEGCRVWPAGIGSVGYGQVWGDDGKMWSAHRAAYFIHTGQLSKEDMVHHTCGLGAQNACFNIDHLQVVTHRENTAEMVERTAYRRQLLSLRAELDDIETENADVMDFIVEMGLDGEFRDWLKEREREEDEES